jgi:hypothetical protein
LRAETRAGIESLRLGLRSALVFDASVLHDAGWCGLTAPLRHSWHGRMLGSIERKMAVARYKRHTVYAACVEALKELTPVRLALAHRDASADDRTLAVVVDADGREERTGHDGPAKPHPFVPGVETLDDNSDLTTQLGEWHYTFVGLAAVFGG